MSGCKRFQDLIERHIAGEAGPSDLEFLREHSKSCADCRLLMEIHQDLEHAAAEAPEPSEAQFREMRAAVLRQVDVRARAKDGRRRIDGGFWRNLTPWRAARPAFAFVLAVALLAGGFIVGRTSAPRGGFSEEALITELNRQASLATGLDGYWDSPFLFSNVSAKKRDDGYVAMSFDVTQHVNLDTRMSSPLVKEVLLHAILSSSNIGSRFDAIKLADESADPKLKEVLVFTLLNDPSLPVRLSALNVLRKHTSDPAVQDALLTTIGQDPSVQIRFLALDCLASRDVGPEAIRKAVGESPDDAGLAVLERANELF